MSILPTLDYAAPGSLPEALALLSERPGALVLAGGHDLIPGMKAGRASPPMLVDLRRIASLRSVAHKRAPGRLWIGAMVTLSEILADQDVREGLPALQQAADAVGDAQVRNRTTLVGNLASRHPASDMAAAALALEAVVHTARPSGTRAITAGELLGGRETALEPAEIITWVEFPVPEAMTGSAYEKHTNPATCYPICGVAASVMRTPEDTIGECRVAATGVFGRPSRLSEVEAAVEGTAPTRASVRDASRHAGAGGAAVSDLSASGEYRSHLVTVLVERALVRAAQDAGFRFQ
jgi:carbon-monoxide dehydrogenase medium subunit